MLAKIGSGRHEAAYDVGSFCNQYFLRMLAKIGSGRHEAAYDKSQSMVENKTSDILQESRSMQIRRKGTNSGEHIQSSGMRNLGQELLINSAQPRV